MAGQHAGSARGVHLGNLFFTTGNSAQGTYDGVRNIQESVAKVDPQLVNLLGIFTPSIEDFCDRPASPRKPGRLAISRGEKVEQLGHFYQLVAPRDIGEKALRPDASTAWTKLGAS
jgi:hypothetical protein